MIKLKEKIGYGLGDMASSMFWKLFGAYLMIFYTDVFGLPAAMVGTMFLVTRVWDSVFDPVIGIIADRTSSRWGKFRPYLLFLAIPFGIIGILTFYTPPFGEAGKLVYAYITYSLMMMVYSGINVPYASLLGVMSPNPKERGTLSTFRMMFAALLLFMPMANAFSGHSSDIAAQQHGWLMAVMVIAVMCVLLFFGCFSWTKERVKPINEAKSSLKDDIHDLFHNRPWWILFGAGIASLVFNSIRDGAAVLPRHHAFRDVIRIKRAVPLCRPGSQYPRRSLGGSGQQQDRQEKHLCHRHAPCHCAQHHLLLVRQKRPRMDIRLPMPHQYLCRKHLSAPVVDVCRLCRLFGTAQRKPRYRTYLQCLVDEPEVRLDNRHGSNGLAALLLRIPSQCRTECRDHPRHQTVPQLVARSCSIRLDALRHRLSAGRAEDEGNHRQAERETEILTFILTTDYTDFFNWIGS